MSVLLKRLDSEWGQRSKILGQGEEPSILTHEETLLAAFRHFHKLLGKNSGGCPVHTSLDWASGPRPDLYLSFAIESEDQIFPEGMEPGAFTNAKAVEAPVAWTALFEPFVGSENFAYHSKGLRIETSRIVRHVAALGGRSGFQFSGRGEKVELLVVFKSIET
jgi:hypothetical protein